MENSFYNMELSQFISLFADQRSKALGDDFCIVDVRFDQNVKQFFTPARLNAYLLLFCVEGNIRLSINMKEFDIAKNQVALFIPGYIGQLVDFDQAHKENLHYMMVAISSHFLSRLNLDLNRLFSDGVLLLDSPCVTLTDEERALAFRYVQLASEILSSSISNKRQCLGSLLASIFYLAEGIFSHQLAQFKPVPSTGASRADDVFNKFLRVLAEFHMSERNVRFYADRLCLSPKYFSKLIKAASGRCAPEWIDSYVILEAKNFLMYSDMSIKEIVYRLHFSAQPTFTKFFKAHTGMTPAQYRKS